MKKQKRIQKWSRLAKCLQYRFQTFTICMYIKTMQGTVKLGLVWISDILMVSSVRNPDAKLDHFKIQWNEVFLALKI